MIPCRPSNSFRRHHHHRQTEAGSAVEQVAAVEPGRFTLPASTAHTRTYCDTNKGRLTPPNIVLVTPPTRDSTTLEWL